MSVNSYLTQVSSKLVLSDSEKSSINTSINTLKTRLDSFFRQSIINHFQFGSSTRGTILPGKADINSDIDYMIVFNISKGKEKPHTYIEQLRSFASAKYSASEIGQSNPMIVLSLNNINFELVPAIYNSETYEIPSKKSYWTDWISTDPDRIKKDIHDKNKSNHNNIKPLVRLIKYWNATKHHPYVSFSLEKHIINKYYLFCTSLKDYFYAFWDDISYNFNTARDIIELINSAKKHINRARDYEKDNMPRSAEKEIKKIVPEL
ncbi:MAG: hypothetical protein PVG39_11500 [Desulfobacteraceae bacterium]|jgi:hypothetical protein